MSTRFDEDSSELALEEFELAQIGAGSSEEQEYGELELRIIAEKIMELLRRDALIARERSGLADRWPGWRQS
ncbi:MAG: hypothetical protein KF753_10635 [Caldilineaceae bacterium]|nr:hypothetical protein [Caldilineaceae bacterium]